LSWHVTFLYRQQYHSFRDHREEQVTVMRVLPCVLS